MAEPTMEEKLAAAQKALADLGVSDADEANRAVAVFWSQVPLLPAVKPSEPVPPSEDAAPVLVTSFLDSADPAMKKRIKALGEEAAAIMKAIMASGGSPA